MNCNAKHVKTVKTDGECSLEAWCLDDSYILIDRENDYIVSVVEYDGEFSVYTAMAKWKNEMIDLGYEIYV